MRGLMTGLMFCGLRAWCVGLRAVRGDARWAMRGHPPATPSAPSAATHAPDEGTTLARSTPCMFQRHSCHSPAP